MKPDDHAEIIKKLKRIIRFELESKIDLDEIKEDVSLFEEGIGLDSISIVNLIVAIEKEFNIEFEEDKIDPKTFDDLKSLSTYIEQKLSSVDLVN